MNLLRNTRLRWLLSLIFLLVAGLSGCQHNESSDADESGEVVIELTDAEGDFTNYTVTVTSISLTKKNDSVVEVLPESTRVDFSQYVEMTELLTSATVPSGFYKAATLRLDYSDAEIFVEDADGNSIQATSILDESGDPITTLETVVTLEETNQLRIARGIPALLSLDFDLKTSNAVSFDDGNNPVVTVSPVLNASLTPDEDKTHRIRGPLKNVDVNNASFDLIIRPFNHRFNSTHERFGNFTVNTSETTTFELNGESFVGEEGIAAMDSLDKLTGVIVTGEISFNPKRFSATEVYAGSSVPGGDMDAVTGTVLSRADNTLTIKGATLIRSGGSVLFNDSVNVLISPSTVVKKERDDGDYTPNSISVGQRLTVFGTLNDDTANPELDATEGFSRLHITTLTGRVANNNGDPVAEKEFAITLKAINGRRLALFDFSGTGIDNENDADPDFYEIDQGSLDTSNFPIDLPVQVRGFVSDFGSAPDDFIAKSITGTENVRARMHTNWRPATGNAFTEISSEALTLNFEGTGKFSHLGHGRRHVDLSELDLPFTLIPNENGEGLFVINIGNVRHVHLTFANFIADIEDQLADEKKVGRITANGSYEILTGKFTIKSAALNML